MFNLNILCVCIEDILVTYIMLLHQFKMMQQSNSQVTNIEELYCAVFNQRLLISASDLREYTKYLKTWETD